MTMQAHTQPRNIKVMNRFDLTSRLVTRLKNDEAVVGGICPGAKLWRVRV